MDIMKKRPLTAACQGFGLRVIRVLYDAAQSQARIERVSLNQWISEAIRQRLERDLLSLD